LERKADQKAPKEGTRGKKSNHRSKKPQKEGKTNEGVNPLGPRSTRPQRRIAILERRTKEHPKGNTVGTSARDKNIKGMQDTLLAKHRRICGAQDKQQKAILNRRWAVAEKTHPAEKPPTNFGTYARVR